MSALSGQFPPFPFLESALANVPSRIMESLKAGIRLPEARFSPLKIAREGQRSVYGMYGSRSIKVPSTELAS